MKLNLPSISINIGENKKEDRITSDIISRTKQREKQEIKNWRNALQTAESNKNPDRDALVAVFQEIILDPHVQSVIQSRKLGTLQTKMTFSNSEEKFGSWFEKFIEKIIEARFWGYSLVSLGDIEDGMISNIHEVPRQNVVPDHRQYIPNINNKKIRKDIDAPDIKDWNILIVDNNDKGLLNNIAPYALWKKSVLGAWALFADIYGIPLTIGRTDKNDKKSRDQMNRMLKQLSTATYGVFGFDEKIEVITGSVSGSHDTFRDFAELANAEISKAILGQTMTTESGSSLSQAEVHKDIMDTIIKADKNFIKTVVNNELIPRLQNLGVVGDTEFDFDESEEMGVKEKWEIDKGLLQFYNLPTDYIEETYGTPVEGREMGVNKMDTVNRVFDDYPESNTQKALDFAEGKGYSNRAIRIARRLKNKESLGRKEISDIASYKRYLDNEGEENSPAAVMVELVGGRKMIEWANKRLQELKSAEKKITSNFSDIKDYYERI